MLVPVLEPDERPLLPEPEVLVLVEPDERVLVPDERLLSSVRVVVVVLPDASVDLILESLISPLLFTRVETLVEGWRVVAELCWVDCEVRLGVVVVVCDERGVTELLVCEVRDDVCAG